MLTGLSGPTVTLSRGDPHEPATDAEAIRLIDAGFAKAEDPKEEKAARAKIAAAEKEAAEKEAAEKEAAEKIEQGEAEQPGNGKSNRKTANAKQA
ncbi:hypothetical protein V5F89_12435 [Pelagerythrobacter marensis]|uniref:Uncharacterized protein n=1 Tax=Pelagerythrobacter marensis TaxID=543877 RepID=A0ABZ2D5J8_9SPHN